MLLLEHPPVYTLGALGRSATCRRRGLLPRARDRRRAHAARRPAHLPRPRAARRLPDHARRERAEYILTMERIAPRSPTRAEAHPSSATSSSACRRWVGATHRLGGVHISHGVSAHGFAVNVDNDLDPFTGSWPAGCRGADDLDGGRGRRPRACRASASARRGASARRSARRRARSAWSSTPGIDGLMDVGLAIFLTGDGIHPAVLAQARRGARLRVADGHRAHAHPGLGGDGRTATAGPLDEKYRAPRHVAFRGRSALPACAPRARPTRSSTRCCVIEHARLRAAAARAAASCALGGLVPLRLRRRRVERGEMLNHHGPGQRDGNMSKRVDASRRYVRTTEQANVATAHVDVDPIWQWPKPRLHRRLDRTGKIAPTARTARAALRRRLAEHRQRPAAASTGSTPSGLPDVPVTFYGATAAHSGTACASAGVDARAIVLDRRRARRGRRDCASIPSL